MLEMWIPLDSVSIGSSVLSFTSAFSTFSSPSGGSTTTFSSSEAGAGGCGHFKGGKKKRQKLKQIDWHQKGRTGLSTCLWYDIQSPPPLTSTVASGAADLTSFSASAFSSSLRLFSSIFIPSSANKRTQIIRKKILDQRGHVSSVCLILLSSRAFKSQPYTQDGPPKLRGRLLCVLPDSPVTTEQRGAEKAQARTIKGAEMIVPGRLTSRWGRCRSIGLCVPWSRGSRCLWGR